MFDAHVIESIAGLVGAPVEFEELKVKPGRRQTVRAHGAGRSAIVKAYATERACIIGERLIALAAGPSEPMTPRVLSVDRTCRLLVLSDLPGRPLREAVIEFDGNDCRRAGAAIGRWHGAWQSAIPASLTAHTPERELAILRQRAAAASPEVAVLVEACLANESPNWAPATVVHRDLYEEQVLLGDRVALIDLDDAAAGPPELDVGNLLAHLELLGRRRSIDVSRAVEAFMGGYIDVGPPLEGRLLAQCRALTLLRLACLNNEPGLIDLAMDPART